MTHKTITLTGWGQPYDALASVAPRGEHIDYATLANIEQAMEHIAHCAHAAECVVGWSMGGMIACQMIARRMIAPKKLILIATPFQFVESAELKLGMKKPLYDQFVDNYRRNPSRTLNKSYLLIAHGDKERLRVDAALNDARKKVDERHWLYWLEVLGQMSCSKLDVSHFPETRIIHGLNDVVVSPTSAEAFHQKLPSSTLELLPDCGHAPHWHQPLTHA